MGHQRRHRLSVRATGYTWHVPFNNVTAPPLPARHRFHQNQLRGAGNLTSTHTSIVNEVKIGLITRLVQQCPLSTPEYRLPTITVGAPYNYPQC